MAMNPLQNDYSNAIKTVSPQSYNSTSRCFNAVFVIETHLFVIAFPAAAVCTKTECFIAETAKGCDMDTLVNEEAPSPPGKH